MMINTQSIFESLAPIALWSGFWILVVMSMYIGGVLFYHYKNFSVEPAKSIFVTLVYTFVCGGLLLAAFSGISLYINSL